MIIGISEGLQSCTESCLPYNMQLLAKKSVEDLVPLNTSWPCYHMYLSAKKIKNDFAFSKANQKISNSNVDKSFKLMKSSSGSLHLIALTLSFRAFFEFRYKFMVNLKHMNVGILKLRNWLSNFSTLPNEQKKCRI